MIKQIPVIGLFLEYANEKRERKEELKAFVLSIFDSEIREFFCVEKAEQDVQNTQKELDEMNALYFPCRSYFDPESSSIFQLNAQLKAQKAELEQKRRDASLHYGYFEDFMNSAMTQTDLDRFRSYDGCPKAIKYATELRYASRGELELERILNYYLSTNDVLSFLYIMEVQEQDCLDKIEDKLLVQLPPRKDSIPEAKGMVQGYLAQKECIAKKLLDKIAQPEASASRRPPLRIATPSGSTSTSLQISNFANTLDLANIERRIGVREKEYIKSLQDLTQSSDDIIACVSLYDTPEKGVLLKQFSDWCSLNEIQSDIDSFRHATGIMDMTREDILCNVEYTKASIAPLLEREVGIANKTFAKMQKELDWEKWEDWDNEGAEEAASSTDAPLPTLLGRQARRFDPSKRD